LHILSGNLVSDHEVETLYALPDCIIDADGVVRAMFNIDSSVASVEFEVQSYPVGTSADEFMQVMVLPIQLTE